MRRRLAAALLLALAARAARAEDVAELARVRAREVFGRPEFQPLADADKIPRLPEIDTSWLSEMLRELADILKSILEPIGDALGDLLDWMTRGIRNLFRGGGGAAADAGLTVSAMVGWVLAIVAVAVLVYLVVRMLRASATERRAAGLAISFASGGGGEEDALARTPEDWRRRAERLAAGGQRREALRALYLELLAGLHRAGAIDYDRTRTNTAYVRDVPRTHAAHDAFHALTGHFDRAVYGQHEPDHVTLRAAAALVESVKRAFAPEPARVR